MIVFALCVLSLMSPLRTTLTVMQVHSAQIKMSSLDASSLVVNSSKVMADLVELAASGVSLQALRSVQETIQERNFHEATHILYDIRTMLGDRRVKYLEIGSYTGVSSSLMLKHPFSTFVTGVDPCVLPLTHFKGEASQEETIRKNLLAGESKESCDLTSLWRLQRGFSPQALPRKESFDIIFIDGDHSAEGVWSDYNHTLGLLRPGGFMVFDDYIDSKHSPAVRPSVDKIASSTDLVPIGTPPDVHGIHPDSNLGVINEYIFLKRGRYEPKQKLEPKTPLLEMPLLCVVVASDGLHKWEPSLSTLESLWEMLVGQSYNNWRLYLTGYNLTNIEEWRALSFYNDAKASIQSQDATLQSELPRSHMWSDERLDAINEGIERAVSDGNEWIVNLHVGDLWDKDHLENIYSGIVAGSTFVMTSCQTQESYLPRETLEWAPHLRHDVPPRPCGNSRSSVAFNAALLQSRYLKHPIIAADDHLWSRMMFEENFIHVFVPIVSCYQLPDKNHFLAKKVRKTLMDGVTPIGWHRDSGTEVSNEYTTLATNFFPENISRYCLFVVGPKEGHHSYSRLAEDMVPYHIRKVKDFSDMPVWKRQNL